MITEQTITISPADKAGFTLTELADALAHIRDKNPDAEFDIKASTTMGMRIRKLTITLRTR